MATLQDVEDWLIKITEYTRLTKEAIEKGGAGGAGAAAKDDAKQDGRFDKLGKRIESALTSQLATRIAQAQSLANRGFQGTVQEARFDFAMEQLARQFAAVMMPVMQGATYLAEQVERRMRMMGGAEQNRLLGAGIGAYAGLRYGGLGGALAGGLAGSLIAGPSAPGDSMRGAAAGAYLGWRVAGPAGAAVGAGVGAVSGSGDYGRLRGEGSGRLRAAAGAGIGAVTDLGYYTLGAGGLGIIGGVNPMDAIRREADARAVREGRSPGPRPEDHRDVTPFRSEMLEAGGTYFEAQKAAIRATAGGEEDGGPLKPIVDLLVMVVDNLGKLVAAAGGSPAAPPTSAGSAR